MVIEPGSLAVANDPGQPLDERTGLRYGARRLQQHSLGLGGACVMTTYRHD